MGVGEEARGIAEQVLAHDKCFPHPEDEARLSEICFFLSRRSAPRGYNFQWSYLGYHQLRHAMNAKNDTSTPLGSRPDKVHHIGRCCSRFPYWSFFPSR